MAGTGKNWPTLALLIAAVLAHFFHSRTTNASLFQAHPSRFERVPQEPGFLKDDEVQRKEDFPFLENQNFHRPGFSLEPSSDLNENSQETKEPEIIDYPQLRQSHGASPSRISPLLSLYSAFTSKKMFSEPNGDPALNLSRNSAIRKRMDTGNTGKAVPYGEHFFYRIDAHENTYIKNTS